MCVSALCTEWAQSSNFSLAQFANDGKIEDGCEHGEKKKKKKKLNKEKMQTHTQIFNYVLK